MDEKLTNIDIRGLKYLLPTGSGSAIGNDFLISDIKYDNVSQVREMPFKYDGYIAIFCMKGELSVEINLKDYTVRENSLLITVPGYIMKVSSIDPSKNQDLHGVIVAMSRSYIANVRMDTSRLFSESVTLLDNPCISLSDEELDICRKYMSLAKSITMMESIGNKEQALGSLVASILFILGEIWSKRLSAARETSATPSARSSAVFDQFIKLVAAFHTRERNMAFYAEKLCLTPKYLSKIIKNVSGRSAPDWIDSFVIMQAKNLLKYSDLTIKQIVFKLNFPNQSVFYKFFKTHTGMTPSEYRNY